MPSTQPAGSLASLISTPTQPRSVRPRLDSVDLLRGLVMVIMALDHTRDFFSKDLSFDPTDLSRTYPALFLTRWITHYCAPVFMFLAGTSAFLSTTRGRTKKGLSWFLLTRGVWLVVLELTWVRCLGWQFNFDYHFSVGAVIWALGWSMIALAGLVFLALPVITALGVLMIATHNLFDPPVPERLQLTALAFVSAGDAGAGPAAAGAAGPGDAALAGTDPGLWPRALVLLRPAPSIDPWLIGDCGFSTTRPRRLAFRQLRRL